MTHRVVFTPEAEDQLDALFTYLAVRADPETAAQFIEQSSSTARTLPCSR